ncbi:MAG TPA: glycosyltransferase family A protein [Thermoplasmata archaeon]|nr:glycosyltransferase family A protein [Thermoplasmata archaeon]
MTELPEIPIAGFSVVRNGIRNGYPFLEAIRSALPVCSRVYVGEGFSDDGTYEALEALQRSDPRIVLCRIRWEAAGGGGAPIRTALNALRAGLTEPWLFQFDANDVIPAEDVPVLRRLPTLHPDRDLLALPYRQFLGRYAFNEEFRFRLVRNLPTIRVLWDGWTMGFHLAPSELLRPREFRRVLARTALAVVQDRVAVHLPEEAVYLPRPIHHYYGLFPESFTSKMLTKEWLQANPHYRTAAVAGGGLPGSVEQYGRDHDYDGFWRKVLDHQQALRALGVPLNKEFPYAELLPNDGHPPLIRPRLGQPRYEVGVAK